MTEAVIEARDIRFAWGAREAPTLQIARFAVAPGERLFLHGPSGSGKSTLLGVIGGVLRPQRGELRVLQADLARLGSSARDAFRVDHLGFIFQQFNLIPYLSVIDNVILPCRFSRRRHERAARTEAGLRDEARRLLDRLDVAPGLRARDATRLSVGQQQRVAAARALIGRPEVIIADEPTSSLDAQRQQAFLDLLLAECEASGAALVFVSHDWRLADSFSRRVAMEDINKPGAAENSA